MTEERIAYGDEMPSSERFVALREGTGHGSRISCERVYIEAMNGDLYGGLFVSQLVFWSGKAKRDGWFYRSYDEWAKEDYLNEYQVRKLAKRCVEAGWLETRVMKAKGAPTVHYRIKQPEFMLWLDSKRPIPILSNERMDTAKSQDGYCEMKESIDTAKSQDHIQTPIQTPITYMDVAATEAPPVPAAAPTKKRAKKESHPNTTLILHAYKDALGYNSINYAAEGKGAAQLAQDGWQPEQVVECYRSMKADPFWKSKHLSLQSVFKQIGAHFAHRSGVAPPASAPVTIVVPSFSSLLA